MFRARIHTHLGNFLDARATYQEVLGYEPGHIGALCAMVVQGHGDEVGGLASVEARLNTGDITNIERNALCVEIHSLNFRLIDGIPDRAYKSRELDKRINRSINNH